VSSTRTVRRDRIEETEKRGKRRDRDRERDRDRQRETRRDRDRGIERDGDSGGTEWVSNENITGAMHADGTWIGSGWAQQPAWGKRGWRRPWEHHSLRSVR
jgi:hypothetical protein